MLLPNFLPPLNLSILVSGCHVFHVGHAAAKEYWRSAAALNDVNDTKSRVRICDFDAC